MGPFLTLSISIKSRVMAIREVVDVGCPIDKFGDRSLRVSDQGAHGVGRGPKSSERMDGEM